MLLEEIKPNPEAYKPTEHERQVISTIMSVDTPQMAEMQCARDAKLNYAAQRLAIMGFIDNDNGLSMTDTGMEVAKAQGLVDEMGEPTEQSDDLTSSDSPE